MVTKIARAARNREIISVGNVRQASDWLPNPLLPDTYAEMAIPILLEGETVGVLDVQADEIGALDEADASVLRSLANQVAVAIRNAQTFAQTEAALSEAQALQGRYVEQAWETTSLAGQEYHYHRAGAPLLEETDQSEAALVSPIKVQNQIIGSLHLAESDPNRRKPLTDQERAFVQAVADQVAQSAENLRLFEETRERAGREATIRQVTEELRSAQDLDQLLDIATKSLGQHLSARYTKLQLGMTAEPDVAENGNSNPVEDA